MGEFIANVKAVLEVKGIQSQIDDISKIPVKLQNVTINASNLRSEIENALKGSFSIDVTPNISGVSMKGAAQSVAKGMSAQMKVVSPKIASSVSSSISNALKQQGIDGKVSDAIGKDIGARIGSSANVNLKSVKATIEEVNSGAAKLSKVRITAFDDIGNQINSIATYGKDGIKVATDFARQFSNTAASVQKSSKEIANSVKQQIDTHSVDASVSKVASQWEKYKNVIHNSKDEIEENYRNLQKFRDYFSDPNNYKDLSDTQLVNQWESYSEILKTAQNDMATLRNEGTKLASAMDISTLDNRMAAWLQKNTKATKEYGNAIGRLRSQLGKDSLTEIEKTDIAKQFQQITTEASAKGLTGKSFLQQLKSAGTQMLGFVSVAQVVNTAVRGFKEMYKAVYDIDTAMTNLKKVTDETDRTYASFLERSAKSSQELGRTVSSLVEQTAAWSKLGYSLSEAEELSKLSSIYANVAEVSDQTAVSDIVTALKAYGLEISDAIKVVDSLNELGNRFATDAASLGQGLAKSASAMNAAGTDMYKTLAMLTGGTEITQNADAFGSFLKVASMRLRGMKGELEELGEEVDPAVDSISKVQTQILNLTGGKVNIFDAKGEFRDYYDIMLDIANVYDKLFSTDRASLSEILFGKMRGNQGAALIQAFQSGQIQKAYKTALESSGSAYEEQARWMQSLEAKTQQFQAALQGLSMEVLNSDFLKGTVDVGTGLLNILTKIIDTVGILTPLLASGGVTAFFKNLD